MRPPAEVLAHYPSEVARETTFLAGAGGLSGARIWHVRGDAGEWCLKVWPAATTSAEQLVLGHRLMDLANRAGLDYVPRVLATRSAASFIETAEGFWDLTSWQPGQPATLPNLEQLRSAGRALGLAHAVWAGHVRSQGPCPGIARRLAALADVDHAMRAAPATELAVAVARAAPHFRRELERWREVSFPLSPCLCDVRREHVLFENDAVTGLIDFGAARLDHPANDLARYLGDAVGGDPIRWQPLLDAYAAVRPLSEQERLLVAVLERSGVVASALYWLRNPDALQRLPGAGERIAELTRRLLDLRDH